MNSKHNIATRPANVRGRSQFWVRGLESSKQYYDERALAMFQADVLIPEQFLATYKRTIHLDAEKTLMFAVLQDAVICFQEYVAAYDKRRRMLFLDAEEWILENDPRYLFSFESVCECLGFDASYLRHGLMRWKDQALARVRQRRLAI
jgi:hypothetical protein